MPETLEPQLDELRRRARRRLVGAVVLALAAAVLVPMLLESDPKPLGEDVSVKIPPVDNSKFVSRLGDKGKDAAPAKSPTVVEPSKEAAKDAAKEATKETAKEATAPPAVPPPPPKAAAESEARTGAPTPKAPAPEPSDAGTTPARDATSAAPVGSAPPPVVAKPPTPASDVARTASDPAKATMSTPAKSGSYSVQLAAFSDDKGANALAGRLKRAGHPAYTEPYTTSRGTLWRVRVGPYGTRDAAEAARAKLKADGQNGIIAQAN